MICDLTDTKWLVIEMLRRHHENIEKYLRIEQDDTIQEWKADYMTRLQTGGLKSQSLRTTHADASKKDSIEESLLMEQQHVLDNLRDLKLRIQVVKVLLLNIRQDNLHLIEMRYFQKMPVEQVCAVLFCSRSTYYRRHNQTITALAREFERLFGKEDRGRMLQNF